MHVCLLLLCCFKATRSCTGCSKITFELRGSKKICWMHCAIVLSGQSVVSFLDALSRSQLLLLEIARHF